MDCQTKNSYIKRFSKWYPFLKGFTDDLLFFVAIDTLFFTMVKNLSLSEISLLTAISSFIAIICRFLFLKIILKLGNTFCVRLGMILLLLSAIIMTTGHHFVTILLGKTLYEFAFIFKDMEMVVLKNNLSVLGKENQYATIANKGMIIYAFLTFIVALSSGILFNINPYLPMILCILVCFIFTIFYFFMKDVSIYNKKNTLLGKQEKIKFSNIVWPVFLCYGLFFGLITIGMQNSKLLIQYELSDFYISTTVSFYLSIVIAFSRIARLFRMILYGKIYTWMKEKSLFLFPCCLLFSFLLIISGYCISFLPLKFFLMAFGFCLILSVRDPFRLYIQDMVLRITSSEQHQTLISYIELARKIGISFCCFIISVVLFHWELIYAIVAISLLAFSEIIIAIRLYRMVLCAS